jgi:hypothetical protein
MEILFLTTVLPRNKNGGEVASEYILDALQQNGYNVTVVGYFRKDEVLDKKPQEILVDQRYIETKKSKIYTIIWLVFSLLKGLPYSAAKYYSNRYIKIVKELIDSKKYKVFIIDHAQIGWIERFIEAKDKLVIIAHNVEHEVYGDSANSAGSFVSKWIYKREANLIKSIEDRLAVTARQVWTIAQHDFNYFSSIKRGVGVKLLSFGLAKKSIDKPLNKSFDIGIIGSWAWRENEEGLQWFLQTVYPLLPTDLSIHVAGHSAEWLAGKYPNIHYLGFVPDAQEFMAQAKVMAIPTVSGSGVEMKTLDAIASGSAIVLTPLALRGISDYPRTVKIAEKPEDFANLLVGAIASSSAQQAFNDIDDVLDWSRTRQNKFIADIACAINEL